jgi:hypothetical protein
MQTSLMLRGSLVAVALVLVGAGCNPLASVQEKVEQKVAEKATEIAVDRVTGGKVDLNSKDGSVTFKDNETGNTVAWGADVKLPDDFPKELPVYPDAKIVAAAVDRSDAGNASTYVLSVSDAPKVAVAWYETELKKAGWTVKTTLTTEGFESRVFAKGEAQINVMSVPGDEGKTVVNASYRPKGN